MGDGQSARASSRRRWLAVLILLAAGLDYVDLARASWGFVTDDMYISLRYARSWVHGHGLAWNPGDGVTVEGYSNFSFVALAAAALELGLDPVLVLKWIGAVSVPVAAVTLHVAARQQVGPVWATIPGIVLLSFPGTAWWAVSGLETGLFVALAAGSVAAFAYALRRPGSIGPLVGAGVLVALASITRPEGPLLGMALGLAFVVDRLRTLQRVHPAGRRAVASLAARSGLALVLGFAILYLPYFTWRAHVFGRLLPNTVACKAAHVGDPWRLLLEAAPMMIPCWLAAAGAGRALLRPVNLACLLLGLLYAAALYGASPTVAYLGRHFLAAFAVTTIPASVGIAALASGRPGPALVVALALKTTLAALLLTAGARERLEHAASGYAARAANRLALATWLEATLAPGEAYVMGDVGLVGWETPRLRVLDAYCLNDPDAVAPDGTLSKARFATRALAKRPAAIIMASKDPAGRKPRSSVYRRFLESPDFWLGYAHARTFAGPADDGFHYLVFRRNDDQDPVAQRSGP